MHLYSYSVSTAIFLSFSVFFSSNTQIWNTKSNTNVQPLIYKLIHPCAFYKLWLEHKGLLSPAEPEYLIFLGCYCRFSRSLFLTSVPLFLILIKPVQFINPFSCTWGDPTGKQIILIHHSKLQTAWWHLSASLVSAAVGVKLTHLKEHTQAIYQTNTGNLND